MCHQSKILEVLNDSITSMEQAITRFATHRGRYLVSKVDFFFLPSSPFRLHWVSPGQGREQGISARVKKPPEPGFDIVTCSSYLLFLRFLGNALNHSVTPSRSLKSMRKPVLKLLQKEKLLGMLILILFISYPYLPPSLDGIKTNNYFS